MGRRGVLAEAAFRCVVHSLRTLAALALLSSCSVYSEALLHASKDGQGQGSAGSLAIGASPSKGGAASSAGNHGGSESSTPGDAGGSGDEPNAGTSGSGDLPAGSSGSGGSSGDAGQGGSGSVTPGGAAGSGGAPPMPTGVDLLDDMEDGNFYLTPRPPRHGFWYVAGDGTAGAVLPKLEELIGVLAPVRDGSTSAVHFSASGFKGWGASLGLSFTDQASKRVKYDAGSATGISFWLRGTVTGNAKVRVLFPLPGTDPLYELCGDQAQGECLDHYATQVSVTADWQQITIPFSSLHQAGWGAPVAQFDATEMLGIEWSTGTVGVDIWLDDLALIRPP